MPNKETPKSWTCECGKVHEFGVWVAAHWTERLTHMCEICGAEHEVHRGIVTLKMAGKRRKKVSA